MSRDFYSRLNRKKRLAVACSFAWLSVAGLSCIAHASDKNSDSKAASKRPTAKSQTQGVPKKVPAKIETAATGPSDSDPEALSGNQLSAHYPKNSVPACAASAEEKKIFSDLEAQINHPNPQDQTPLIQAETLDKKGKKLGTLRSTSASAGAFDKYCSSLDPSNRPALKTCWNTCAKTFERGRQDGLSKIQPWTRSLTRDDGFPRPISAKSEFAPFLGQSPCNPTELKHLYSEGAETLRRKESKDILMTAVNGCCLAGFDRGRERLRAALGATLLKSKNNEPHDLSKIPDSRCNEDFKRGREVGTSLCSNYEFELKHGCKDRYEVKSRTGQRSSVGQVPTEDQPPACGMKPVYTCLPMCFALGIEATANGRNDDDPSGSRCAAQDQWFAKCAKRDQLGNYRDPALFDQGGQPASSAPTTGQGAGGNVEGGN